MQDLFLSFGKQRHGYDTHNSLEAIVAKNDTVPSFRSSELDSSDIQRGLIVKIIRTLPHPMYKTHGKKRRFVEIIRILPPKIVRYKVNEDR